MSRRKLAYLTPDEIDAFLEAATAFHRVLTRPLIEVNCEHYRSLAKLHDAVLIGIKEITGKDAPWISRGYSDSRISGKK
jgi:hypothetical protein